MKYSDRWDLTTIPDDALKSEWARRSSTKRKVKTGGRNGGRPKKETSPELMKALKVLMSPER